MRLPTAASCSTPPEPACRGCAPASAFFAALTRIAPRTMLMLRLQRHGAMLRPIAGFRAIPPPDIHAFPLHRKESETAPAAAIRADDIGRRPPVKGSAMSEIP